MTYYPPVSERTESLYRRVKPLKYTVGLVHAKLAQHLRICRKKSQIRRAVATAVARKSGRSDRPASDLEMDTLEVTGYIAFLKVVALKNKPDHQVDADGERQ